MSGDFGDTSGGAPASSPAQALDDAITSFREVNSDALHDKGHLHHERAVRELSQLYERRYPEQRPLSPAGDQPAEGAGDAVEQAAEATMVPLAAHEFDIGEHSHWAANLTAEQMGDGWDYESEAFARQTLERAGASAAHAAVLREAYGESLSLVFDQTAAYQQSVQFLQREYGPQNVQRVLDGTRRMISAVGGQQAEEWLKARPGFSNHPHVIRLLTREARRRGYV